MAGRFVVAALVAVVASSCEDPNLCQPGELYTTNCAAGKSQGAVNEYLSGLCWNAGGSDVILVRSMKASVAAAGYF